MGTLNSDSVSHKNLASWQTLLFLLFSKNLPNVTQLLSGKAKI